MVACLGCVAQDRECLSRLVPGWLWLPGYLLFLGMHGGIQICAQHKSVKTPSRTIPVAIAELFAVDNPPNVPRDPSPTSVVLCLLSGS